MSHYIPEHRFQYITVSIVLTALIIGILIPSIELVIGLVGSTIGVAICIMFPASCFIKTNKKGSTERLLAQVNVIVCIASHSDTEEKIFDFLSFQFLLVFAFALMILGTFANLEAIDEQHAGIHDSPPQNPIVDPVPFVKKLPQSIADDRTAPQAGDPRNSGSIGKRKPNKMHKIGPSNEFEQIAAPENISFHEMDKFNAKAKTQPIGPSKETIPDGIRPDEAEKEVPEVTIEKKEKPNAEKIVAEPDRSANAKVDSTINKDAIQREEQEIAIEAKEDKQKSLETAKEILNEVKSEWVKQNEKTQQLVLEKIDKISEKVDKIEQLQEEEKQRDSASLKKHEKVLAPEPAVDARQNKNDKQTDKVEEIPARKEFVKNIPDDAKVPDPADFKYPIVESVLPIANAEQKPNANLPPLKSGEKTGRDLLNIKLAKSRTKRDLRCNEGEEEENADEKKKKLPKKTIRLRNTNKYYTKGWRSKSEVFGTMNVHPLEVNKTDPQFDDERFGKYVGLDDVNVISARDKPLDNEDANSDNNDLRRNNGRDKNSAKRMNSEKGAEDVNDDQNLKNIQL